MIATKRVVALAVLLMVIDREMPMTDGLAWFGRYAQAIKLNE